MHLCIYPHIHVCMHVCDKFSFLVSLVTKESKRRGWDCTSSFRIWTPV